MRKLVTIQEILDIQPIDGADAIEVATILGWKVVVKKGTFNKGDKCVYFEIDSLLPELPMFEFLRASSWKEKLNAYRLKTIKLRGQVSQGLALPLSDFEDIVEGIYDGQNGSDLTEILGVEKYEPPVVENNEGQTKGYNWEIPKTDEERVQSNPSVLIEIYGRPFYMSLKLDGTSATYVLSLKDGEPELNVCSRNLCLKEYSEYKEEDGSIRKVKNEGKYWNMADKYNIKEKFINHYNETGRRLAIQGEIIGENIQGNKMNIKGKDIYVFNVYETDDNNNFVKLDIHGSIDIVTKFGMKFVPILMMGSIFEYTTVEELLDLAKGNYSDYRDFENAEKNQPQEGLVIRTMDSTISFKAINNEFLLKGGD